MTIHCRQGPPGRKKRNARAAPPFYGRKPARPAALPGRKKGARQNAPPSSGEKSGKGKSHGEKAAVFRMAARRSAERLSCAGPRRRQRPCRIPAGSAQAGRRRTPAGPASALSGAGKSCMRHGSPASGKGRRLRRLPCRRGRNFGSKNTLRVRQKAKNAGNPPMFRKVCKALRRNPAKFPGTLRRRQKKTPRGAQKKPRKPGRFLLRPARGRRLRAYQTRMTLSARSRLVTISSMLVVSPTCFCSRRW